MTSSLKSFIPSIAITLLPLAASAQINLDSDSQVNTVTAGNQTRPSVAVAPDRSFLIVWDSEQSSGSDVDGLSIQGRWFAPDGTPIGDDFQVNTSFAGDQDQPAVAVSPSGDYVIVWRSEDVPGFPGTESIRLQRFQSDGAPLGGELEVAAYSDNYDVYSNTIGDPSVTVADSGDFLVLWRHSCATYNFPSPDSHSNVRARGYDTDGSPVGSPVSLAGATSSTAASITSRVVSPVAASISDGEYVVAWSYTYSYWGSPQTYEDSIKAKRVTTDGTVLGGPLLVSDTDQSGGEPTSIAGAPDGGFVVVWHDFYSSDSDVSARLFSGDGAPLASSFQVNSLTQNAQLFPAAVTDPIAPGAGFLVMWQSQGSYGDDQSGYSIQSRRFTWTGEPVGDQLQVNSHTVFSQLRPALAEDVAVWQSDTSAGSDSSGTSIQGRFLPPAVFDGVLGWWEAEWDADDSSGMANNGALEGGAGFATGAIGRAFALNGLDAAVTVPSTPNLDLGAGDFTVAYWVKTTDGWPIVVDTRSTSPGIGTGFGAYLEGGCPGIQIRVATASSKFTSSEPVADGCLHHVAIAVDRDATDGGAIYVDGGLVLPFDPTGVSGSLSNSEPLVIGRQGDALGGGGYLGGLIDDVRVYSRALSPAEVQYLAITNNVMIFASDLEGGNALAWSDVVP
jgi:hypothetical protein